MIEGLREVERAIRSGVLVETLLYRPEVTTRDLLDPLIDEAKLSLARSGSSRSLHEVHCSAGAFQKVAYRAEVANVVAVAQRPIRDSLPHLTLNASDLDDTGDAEERAQITPLLLILEGVEKPGNLGAILRSADALGATGVILVDCPAELDHPNCIRNSLGAAFSLEVAVMSFEQVKSLLRDLEITPYVTHLETRSRPLDQLRLHDPCALILGAESTGVRARWIESLEAKPTVIPMVEGRVVDSLNVSVAAALVMYEAARQRRSVTPRGDSSRHD